MAPDIQYCLDSMVELHRLRGDVYAYLTEFKPDLTNWFDYLDDMYPAGPANVDKHAYYAEVEYDKWRKKCSIGQRQYSLMCGVETLKHQTHDMCLAIANDAIDNAKDPNPTDKQIMMALEKGRYKTQELFHLNFDKLFNLCKEEIDRVNRNAVLQVKEQVYGQRRKRYMLEFGYINENRPRKPNKQLEQKKRKIMLRSVDTLTNFLSPDDTKLFLGNKHVDIVGKDFIFRVLKKSPLTGTGWSSLDISVHDRHTSEYLCKLCFYYDNMPTADQLTALILDVNAGNEHIVLRTGNIYAIDKKAQKHKLLLQYNENEPLLLSNTSDFPKMEDQLLQKKPRSGIVTIDDIGFGISENRENFDEVFERSKEMLYKQMTAKSNLLTGFSNKLTIESNPSI